MGMDKTRIAGKNKRNLAVVNWVWDIKRGREAGKTTAGWEKAEIILAIFWRVLILNLLSP